MSHIVKEIEGAKETKVLIVAPTFNDCMKGVQAYLKRYIPAGYGTELMVEPIEDHNGLFIAKLRRFIHCD